MGESIGWKCHRKCHIARRAWAVIRAGFKRDLEPVILTYHVLTCSVHEGERASVFRVKGNSPNAEALFSIILDQPSFVLAPLWRQSHACGRNCHLICYGSAILKA